MLILSRKENESLVLELPNGETITVCLVAYKGDVTKVGINAPDNVTILREELYRNQLKNNRANKM